MPPLEALVPGGKIDQLSHELHVLHAKILTSGLGAGLLPEFDKLLLRVDAAVLEAYGLPPEHERKLLDQFSGKARQVISESWEQTQYIKPSFTEAISLKDYLAITLYWEDTNKRRGELIDKEYTAKLEEGEIAELDNLQKLADQFISLEGIYKPLSANPLIDQLKQKGLWKE